MKNNKDLSHLYAAAGAIAFIVAGVPILESLGTYISNIFGLQSVKLNSKAKVLDVSDGEGCVNAIGFAVPQEGDDDE